MSDVRSHIVRVVVACSYYTVGNISTLWISLVDPKISVYYSLLKVANPAVAFVCFL